MVQGCFQDDRRTRVYLIDRDFEAKKNKYFANSYLEVLDTKISPVCKTNNNPGYIFMQDNTFIYTAYKVQDQFRDIGIIVLDQPPYSLDLNLIKYIQKKLKERIDQYFPEISRKIREKEINLKHLGNIIQACQDIIPKSFLIFYIKVYPVE